jgi:hypothetical protein
MISIASAADLEGFISTNVSLVAPLVSQTFINLPAREKTEFGATYGVTWDFYSQALIMIAAMQRANSIDPAAVKAILEDPTQVWDYPMFVGGHGSFGSDAAKKLYPNLLYNHQFNNSCCVSIIHNGQDTNAAVINP